MSGRRILVLEHAGVGAMLAALRNMSGSEGPYTLIVGGDAVASNGVIEIPDAWAGKQVIVDYKMRPLSAPKPVFTGPRRSKGDRKRNKANRWS